MGRTALHWAAARGRDAVIKVLVTAGADAKIGDARGWTALHCASLHGHIKACAALLHESEASKECADKLGHTPSR